MFCTECSKIPITPPPSSSPCDVDDREPCEMLVREYQNIWSLAAYAKICDFCRLVRSDPRLGAFDRRLRDHDPEDWGDEVYERVMNGAAIRVYRGRRDGVDCEEDGGVFWRCEVSPWGFGGVVSDAEVAGVLGGEIRTSEGTMNELSDDDAISDVRNGD